MARHAKAATAGQRCLCERASSERLLHAMVVEAAGVELVLSIENTQLIHSRNARNSQISMSAKSAYKSRTNKS